MLIAICDDHPADQAVLKSFCEEYCRQENIYAEIHCVASAEEYLSGVYAYQADILLLDIYMDGISGVALAKTLRSNGFGNPIVLVTSSDAHYPEGFAIGALHYLLKPVDKAAVFEALTRCCKDRYVPAHSISVTSNRREQIIPVKSILYMEVFGHQTRIVTTAGKFTVSNSLSALQRAIDDPAFLQCFRSYIVNMAQIAGVATHHFVMKNGDRIPITKRKLTQLKDRYMDYLFNNERAR